MSKLQIVLDSTMLDTFESCPAKYDYRFNRNKTTIEKAKPLDRGSLIHIGTESYYKSLQQKLQFDLAVRQMTKDMEIAIATDCDLPSSESNRCIEVMHEYTQHWRIADENLIINAVEQSFAYELYQDEVVRIIMIGKIDLLVSDNLYNNLPYDHKSYDRDFPVRRLTNQFLNYAYATGSNYLMVNRIGFQTSVPPEKKFKRVPLSYDPLILEQWKQNVIDIVIMKYLPMVSDGKWPMNLTSCDKYNRLCEYYEVCDSSGEEAKVWKLETNFKTSPKWDVSQSLGKKA